jgi:hypothetical protein
LPVLMQDAGRSRCRSPNPQRQLRPQHRTRCPTARLPVPRITRRQEHRPRSTCRLSGVSRIVATIGRHIQLLPSRHFRRLQLLGTASAAKACLRYIVFRRPLSVAFGWSRCHRSCPLCWCRFCKSAEAGDYRRYRESSRRSRLRRRKMRKADDAEDWVR